jgi:hypothetical protein
MCRGFLDIDRVGDDAAFKAVDKPVSVDAL